MGPDDATVVAYLTGGFHRAWVEGFASRSAGFGEAPAGCFEPLEEEGESLSLAAYRWRRARRGPARSASEILSMDILWVKAAASDARPVDVPLATRSLGLLPEVHALALVRVFEHRIELIVTPLAGEALAQVVLQGVTWDAPDATTGEWMATAPRVSDSMSFEMAVVAEDGRRLEVRIGMFAR